MSIEITPEFKKVIEGTFTEVDVAAIETKVNRSRWDMEDDEVHPVASEATQQSGEITVLPVEQVVYNMPHAE